MELYSLFSSRFPLKKCLQLCLEIHNIKGKPYPAYQSVVSFKYPQHMPTKLLWNGKYLKKQSLSPATHRNSSTQLETRAVDDDDAAADVD